MNKLKKALGKGLSDFRSAYGYDENCSQHREWLDNAKKKLRATLTKTNGAPNYDNPFIVDAYLSSYHLPHCWLACWAFKYFFDQFGIPKALYVCDVGAGTQAGCIGLALILSRYKEKPTVYFDAYEPKDKMRNAGSCFWSAFRDSVAANFDPHPRSTLPHRLPDDLPANALRVVTAFHLSLPYNNRWKENNIGEKAQNSLEKAFRLVSPKYGFFTCHKDKEDSLCQAVDNSFIWDEEKGSKPCIPDKPFLPKDSILLLREATVSSKAHEREEAATEHEIADAAEWKRQTHEEERLRREELDFWWGYYYDDDYDDDYDDESESH